MAHRLGSRQNPHAHFENLKKKKKRRNGKKKKEMEFSHVLLGRQITQSEKISREKRVASPSWQVAGPRTPESQSSTAS